MDPISRLAWTWVLNIIVTLLALLLALLITCLVMLGAEKFGLLTDKGPWSWWPLGLFIALLLLFTGVEEKIIARRERARADRLRRADEEADRAGAGFPS